MKILKFCKEYFLYRKLYFTVYLILSLGLSLLSMINPIISGRIIDTLTSSTDTSILFTYCKAMILLLVISTSFGYINTLVFTKIQTTSAYNLNSAMIEHIKKLPVTFFQKDINISYLNQRINSDSNSIISFSINIIPSLIKNIITFMIVFVLLVNLNLIIALILLLLIVIYLFVYRATKRTIYKRALEYKEIQNNYFSKLNEQLNNVLFIKIHEVNDIFKKKLKTSFENLLKHTMAYQKIQYLFSTLDGTISTFSQIAVFLVGGMAVMNRTLSIGSFTIILAYFNMVLGVIKYFYNLFNTYQEINVSYERIIEFMNYPIEVNGEKVLESIETVSVKDLRFRYKEKEIFNTLNLKFTKGNLYCITGDNGSGKSTLISNLLGLYPTVYDGNIYYNSAELKSLDMKHLRSLSIGLTEQSPITIQDSIYNNITLMNQDLPKLNNLEIYLELLGLNEFIASKPMGWNDLINENGTNLSGGEKQKIAILRQFLKNPELMLFDEPTSALDVESKVRFMNYLNEIKNDKIIIIISHDETVISGCDSIIQL